MKLSPRRAISFLAVTAGVLALISWSAHLGRKVWSPQVFAWRNPLKPQSIVEKQANCPVQLVCPRFYSFMSIGSSIGSVLKADVKNVSGKPIHSFTVSFHSLEPSDAGSIGVQPETLLQPKEFQTIGTSSNGDETVTLSVDFVQFADGQVWCADPPRASVKPGGLQAGAQASFDYLRKTLERHGATRVIDVLPYIRVKVEFPHSSTNDIFGTFGFYCGVTNTVARIENAYQYNGLSGVEKFLMANR